jgi:GMP reductase
MKNNLTYDDVSLVAKYYDYNGRSELRTNVTLGEKTFELPVVPANMKCVIDFNIAEWLAKNDYFYIMHRFEPYEDILTWVEKMNHSGLMTSISIGVTEDDKSFIRQLDQLRLKVDYITVDVAHGHSKLMKEMLGYLNSYKDRNKTFVIAGNVMTPEAVLDLKSWGADCCKIGVGPGKSCLTRFKTGFHSPMFSTVKECSECLSNMTMDEKIRLIEKWRKEFTSIDPFNIGFKTEEEFIKEKIERLNDFPIIADGGVRHNGDIFKAIVAGATMVMVGSLFSACEDSPAENVYNRDGVLVGKQYFGSASEYNKGHKRNVEGTLIQLRTNGMTYEEKYVEIKQDIQSAISYSGHNSLKNVKDVEYLILNGQRN